MPAKGRKKGRNQERRRESGSATSSPRPIQEPAAASHKPARPGQSRAAEPRMPSPFSRATGALLAIITGALAVYMVTNGLTADSAGAGAVRVVTGVLLVLLAIVVGVLSVFPEFVRKQVWRRRQP